MTYFLYYTKSGSFIDIKTSNTNTEYPFISINESEKNEILKAKSDKTKIIKVVDGKVKFAINEGLKRLSIVEFRNNELKKIDPYFTDRYIRHRGLTEEDLIVLEAYYVQLLELPQAYDSCSDREEFEYVFVSEKSLESYENIYELVKPSFVQE